MHIHKALLLEKAVDGEGRHGADAEHRGKQVGARPQVGDGAQKFWGVALLLQGVVRGGGALHLDDGGLELHRLLGLRHVDHRALDHQRRAHILLGNLPVVVQNAVLHDDLQGLKAATVVEFDEAKGLHIADGADPAAHRHLPAVKALGVGDDLRDQCSLHIGYSLS